jgi:predicted transposase YdaD
MNHDHRFRDDLPGHLPVDLDALHRQATEKLHLRFSLDDHLVCGQPARDLARVVDRGSPGAVKVAPQLSFDDR